MIDKALNEFGAAKHRYQLGDPFSEEEEVTYEKLVGHTLPDAYREFIIHIGRSGVGPDHGLYTFDLYKASGNGEKDTPVRYFLPMSLDPDTTIEEWEKNTNRYVHSIPFH